MDDECEDPPSADEIAPALDMTDPLRWLEEWDAKRQRALGIPQQLARRLRQTERRALHLYANRGAPNLERSGLTYIGGAPMLPGGTAWPRRAGRPMSFLLQIDLGAASRILTDPDMPSRGVLGFFTDIRPSHDFGGEGSWRVTYHADSDALVRTRPPDDLEKPLRAPEAPADLVAVPSDEGLWDRSTDDEDVYDIDTYIEWRIAQGRRRPSEIHQLLGRHDQGGAADEIGGVPSTRNPGTKPEDWRLLLELGSRDGVSRLAFQAAAPSGCGATQESCSGSFSAQTCARRDSIAAC